MSRMHLMLLHARPEYAIDQVIHAGVALFFCVILAPGGHCDEGGDMAQFESQIRPVLIEHCYECHSQASGKSEGGLLLDSKFGVLEGGDSGPAVVPGEVAESLLIEALQYESFEMPPSGKLAEATIAEFEKWVAAGAPDPRTDPPSPGPKKLSVDWGAASDYWSFQSPRQPAVPKAGGDWSRSPIDNFVSARLQKNGLSPAPEAARETWLRRVTFDLIGLPPTVEELEAFLGDSRPDAYPQVVDRLLASPHYGERWGRHWLDLARYADSNGADENHNYPQAWRYRDYVVRALNADKPYDRFVHEQLAGDLLEASSEIEQRELLTATGFLVIGPKMLAEQDKEKMVADIVDEQLDTVGKVFMGLTLGCSRCHDHKFDPITAEDYYALAGVFHSTRTMEHLEFVSQWNERVLPDAEKEKQLAVLEPQVTKIQEALASLDQDFRAQEIDRAMELLKAELLLGQSPATLPDAAGQQGEHQQEEQESTKEELAKLIQSAAFFEHWRKLSHDDVDEFTRAAELYWPLLVNEAETGSKLLRLLAEQKTPATLEELADALIVSIRRRWEALAVAAKKDEKTVERLTPFEKELFGKDRPFDVARMPGKFVQGEGLASLNAKQKELDALEKRRPELSKAMAADEAPVKLVALHVRGSHLQFSGEPLPRRVPTVFASEAKGNPPVPSFPEESSGRLELAQWLTHPDHPLTARVMVNRIWQGHFGEGLVMTPSNFGLRGELPSHPDLLDWLATEFRENDWSIKHLHREIVLSSTYRMAWTKNETAEAMDPENRLLWRQNRRRLEAEAIRDSLLVIAGRLDHEIGGELGTINGKYEDSGIAWQALDVPRRTLHLSINRAALNDFFSTFDYVDPAASLAKRSSTIVPHQTLFLMNHPLSMNAGWALAQRVLDATESPIDRVRLAYASAFSRFPTDKEMRVAIKFIETHDAAGDSTDSWVRFCRGLLLANELLYVE